MHWIYAGVVGILVGVAVGAGASQLRLPSLVQSLAAVLVAVLLSTGLTLFLWLRYPVLSRGAGGGYFGFGVENLLNLAVLLAFNSVLHFALGLFGTALPWVAERRALVLGCAGGLYSAVAVARALNSLKTLDTG